LLTVRLAPPPTAADAQASETRSEATIDLPQEISLTAPPVHVASENEIIWRLVGSKAGKYNVRVVADGQSADKAVFIGNGVQRISTIRLRGHFFDRIFSSSEPALPENSPIESMSINYPDRNIEVAGYAINWIWLFFILSMVAGFIFKELLGIQI
jgi:hypothetical protein